MDKYKNRSLCFVCYEDETLNKELHVIEINEETMKDLKVSDLIEQMDNIQAGKPADGN